MKKLLKFTPILVFAILLSSCSSVRVAADYDREANFDQYKPLHSLNLVLIKQKLAILISVES